jgi:hypothetical protein
MNWRRLFARCEHDWVPLQYVLVGRRFRRFYACLRCGRTKLGQNHFNGNKVGTKRAPVN